MMYLDNGATSLYKPPCVQQAMRFALTHCANPGRSGHRAAMEAARQVYLCREEAASLFDCDPEQVVFTTNCTHGLNIAVRSLVKPGNTVVISGFEHNAVVRPLYALGAKVVVAGRKLFDPADTLACFADALRKGASAAVFTHCSNVFGYILPVEEMAGLCRQYGVPFVVDAAQSAGTLPVQLRQWGANYIAMPGHKGLLGPQGTGLLLCGSVPEPLLYGGTGSRSMERQMPPDLPERLEAGTLNVPGIAGLAASLRWLRKTGLEPGFCRERQAAVHCTAGLRQLGYSVFSGEHQSGVISFVAKDDCEQLAQWLGSRGIAVRAGLHCAPLAHESAGTLESGTVRVSFGRDASISQSQRFLQILKQYPGGETANPTK